MANVYGLFNIVQLVENLTRVTLETAAVIDNIATTCTGYIINVGVHELSQRDHHMIYCMKKFNGAVKQLTKR